MYNEGNLRNALPQSWNSVRTLYVQLCTLHYDYILIINIGANHLSNTKTYVAAAFIDDANTHDHTTHVTTRIEIHTTMFHCMIINGRRVTPDY